MPNSKNQDPSTYTSMMRVTKKGRAFTKVTHTPNHSHKTVKKGGMRLI
jgi:hypothetical protein